MASPRPLRARWLVALLAAAASIGAAAWAGHRRSVGEIELAVERLCGFVASLYRDLGEFGCCVESPVAEPDVCYTSTNLLAEYVLRHVCGRGDLADRVRAFLDRYPADFYDYYQVLLSRPLALPFTAVEHVQVDAVGGVRVVHVRRTSTVIEDYREYANLLALKAVYHIAYGERSQATAELARLSELFDGRGFADAYYRAHGRYEAYKLALAAIASRALGRAGEALRYAGLLLRVSPLATLYAEADGALVGVGDLNLETACLAAMALRAAARPDALPRR